MVMVTRLRTENTIATTKRTNDGVHRDTRVTVTHGSQYGYIIVYVLSMLS